MFSNFGVVNLQSQASTIFNGTESVVNDLEIDPVIEGTDDQIYVTSDLSLNIITLSTPQDIAPTSNVEFNHLYLTGNASIDGSVRMLLSQPSVSPNSVLTAKDACGTCAWLPVTTNTINLCGTPNEIIITQTDDPTTFVFSTPQPLDQNASVTFREIVTSALAVQTASGAFAGNVLTCIDSSGNATWLPPMTLSGGTAPGVLAIYGTANQIITNQGTGMVTLSLPQNVDISANFTSASLDTGTARVFDILTIGQP